MLKIDIEGLEPQGLRSANRLLSLAPVINVQLEVTRKDSQQVRPPASIPRVSLPDQMLRCLPTPPAVGGRRLVLPCCSPTTFSAACQRFGLLVVASVVASVLPSRLPSLAEPAADGSITRVCPV
jgi:hypothetical protein